mgnify:FL=1
MSRAPEVMTQAGFSLRNLKYMRAFAEDWPEGQFVQQVLAQLPWGHNLFEPERLIPLAQGKALGFRSCDISTLKGSFIVAPRRHVERPFQGRPVIVSTLPRPLAWADRIGLSGRKTAEPGEEESV